MFKRIISIAFVCLFAFLLLELSLYLLVRLGYLNIIMPTYSMDSSEDFLPERSFIYGHRHLPLSTYEIKKNCLHTHYQFNSLGFREQEIEKKEKKQRVMVLGDSFMEGLGVKEEERVSDILEKHTGISHLNFAMADKGSTQAYVIYDSIASHYDHSAVLLSVFPTNDFIDDDPAVGKGKNSIRPCWKGKYPDYHLTFVPETAPAKREYSAWKHFLKTHTFTYDALFYLKESVRSMVSPKKYPKTGYFDYTQEQLNRLLFSIKKIKEKAGEKPLTVICIPSHLDLKEQKEITSSVEPVLIEFCNENNIEFIGLYSIFRNHSDTPSETFYYNCDSHWNSLGHKTVAESILTESRYYRELTLNE